MKIELGRTYCDKITGFVGVAVGHCQYITGCTQILISPKTGSDGAYRDGHWIDDVRLAVVGDDKIILEDDGAEDVPLGFGKPAPKI